MICVDLGGAAVESVVWLNTVGGVDDESLLDFCEFDED